MDTTMTTITGAFTPALVPAAALALACLHALVARAERRPSAVRIDSVDGGSWTRGKGDGTGDPTDVLRTCEPPGLH